MRGFVPSCPSCLRGERHMIPETERRHDPMPLTYDEALQFLFPRTTTIKFGLATTRALLKALGDPHEVMPVGPHRRDEREGQRVDAGGRGAARGGMAGGTLHLAPPGLVPRAHPGGRRADRRGARWRCGPSGSSRSSSSGRPRSSRPAPRSPSPTSRRAAPRSRWSRWGWADGSTAPTCVRPLVSAVTKIERDHMKYLGDTLELIACEKAGIAKPGVPFVDRRAGPGAGGGAPPRGAAGGGPRAARWPGRRPGAAAGVRVAGAAQPGGPAPAAERRRGARDPDGPSRALPAAARGRSTRGFASAQVPGRLDRRGKWLFDVAHNPDGIRALVKAHRRAPPAAAAARAGLDPGRQGVARDAGRSSTGSIDRGVLTVAPTAASRGWNAVWLRRWLRDRGRPPARAAWTLVPEFREALETVQEGAGTVLVTGSFHTVGDVMTALGMEVV